MKEPSAELVRLASEVNTNVLSMKTERPAQKYFSGSDLESKCFKLKTFIGKQKRVDYNVHEVTHNEIVA